MMALRHPVIRGAPEGSSRRTHGAFRPFGAIEGARITDPLLDIALRAALAGGEAVMRVYATRSRSRRRDDKTPVTEADLASERVIVAMLAAAFPEIPVVSEETVPEAGFAITRRTVLAGRSARRDPGIRREERRIRGADRPH